MTHGDDSEIRNRIMRLEEADRKLTSEVVSLNGRLDSALLTLTNNVSNLTDAIKALQEAQEKTTELQYSLIRLQERSSGVPDLQRAVTSLTIANERNNVVLQGIKFLTGTVLVAVVGMLVNTFWGG